MDHNLGRVASATTIAIREDDSTQDAPSSSPGLLRLVEKNGQRRAIFRPSAKKNCGAFTLFAVGTFAVVAMRRNQSLAQPQRMHAWPKVCGCCSA